MSLFGKPGTPAPAGGSLFGATSQPATGGLFGQNTATAPASGGLFGQAAKPATSLFGSTPASSGTTTTPATATSGGLFGGGAAASTPSTGGLFGGTNTATNTATSAPATGGLFGGGSAATTSAPATGGLFGAAKPTTTPAVGSTSLFGGANTQNISTTGGTSFFGGGGSNVLSTIGQSAPAGAQTQPAVYIDFDHLEKFHKFNECNDNVKSGLLALENSISEQIRACDDLNSKLSSQKELVESVPVDAEFMERKLHTAKSFLSSDESLLQQIQALSEKDKRSISLSVNVLNYFKHNRPGFNSGTPIEISILPPPQDGEVANNSTMVAYFNDHGQQMEDKLRIFLESVAEVEASLRSVEDQAGSMEGGINGTQQRKELVGGGGKQLNKALRSFHEALQDVGGRLVEVKDGLRALEGSGNKGRSGW